MARVDVGSRGVVSAAVALPLTLLLVGSGGRLIFDPSAPWIALGLPYWVLAAYGLVELGLGVAVWIPYLHRLVGLAIAADAVLQSALNARAGNTAVAVMHAIVAAMAGTIALLWTSARVEPPRPRPVPRRSAA
jgi:hypothetical protein